MSIGEPTTSSEFSMRNRENAVLPPEPQYVGKFRDAFRNFEEKYDAADARGEDLARWIKFNGDDMFDALKGYPEMQALLRKALVSNRTSEVFRIAFGILPEHDQILDS